MRGSASPPQCGPRGSPCWRLGCGSSRDRRKSRDVWPAKKRPSAWRLHLEAAPCGRGQQRTSPPAPGSRAAGCKSHCPGGRDGAQARALPALGHEGQLCSQGGTKGWGRACHAARGAGGRAASPRSPAELGAQWCHRMPAARSSVLFSPGNHRRGDAKPLGPATVKQDLPGPGWPAPGPARAASVLLSGKPLWGDVPGPHGFRGEARSQGHHWQGLK